VGARSVASALKHLSSLRLLQVGLRAKEVCESKAACHFCVVGRQRPSWQASAESEEGGSGEEEREATNIMDLVTLRIKSPSAALEDLEVKAQVGETVRELKEQISLAFPTKPPPGEQKLVYLGKILKDSDRLDEVLRLDDSVSAYTLHLVCALPQQREGLRYRPAPAVLPPAEAAVVPPPATYTAPTTQETNQTMEEMMRSFSTQYTTAMSSLPPSPSEAELAALQELYSQYVGLYMQYLSGTAPGTQYEHLVPQQQQQEVQEGGQGEVQGVQAPGAGMVMNAGAGPGAVAADAGGDRNRDILDWVYVMTRVMLLFSVIYFHSSFWRLAFVAGLGFLVFLYQNRQQGRARRPQQVAPVVPPAPVEEVDEQEEREEGEEEGEGGEEQEEEQPKPSRVAVVVTFITSLISSIIPEQNQVI